MSASNGSDTLWTVVIAGGTAIIGLFSAAIGHLHLRLGATETRIDVVHQITDAKIDSATRADEARHQADEERRTSSAREIWIELRRMNEADREYRERILTRLNELPSRDEVYEALDRQQKSARA